MTTPNEALKSAFDDFRARHHGEKAMRKKFSELLGLPVTPGGRTPTLDKWLASPDSQNFRKCPDHMGNFATIMVVLNVVLDDLRDCQPVQDEEFYTLEKALRGITSEYQIKTDQRK